MGLRPLDLKDIQQYVGQWEILPEDPENVDVRLPELVTLFSKEINEKPRG